MRVVIADTSPINYLILTKDIEILSKLFERLILPSTVQQELSSSDAPPAVRSWIAAPPTWLEVMDTQDVCPFAGLHKGESAAIALAESLEADLLLIDERKGVKVARDRGLHVTGTLGILELASQQGLVDLGQAFERLEKTSFRSPTGMMDVLLKRNVKPGGDPR